MKIIKCFKFIDIPMVSDENKPYPDKIKAQENVAINSLKSLIYSIAMTVEDKYVLEDMLKKLSDEAHIMLDIINDIPRSHQKELLLAYRKLLESHVDAANRKLEEV
jgi:hypothetical protein